jgi:hypothetical protein
LSTENENPEKASQSLDTGLDITCLNGKVGIKRKGMKVLMSKINLFNYSY